MESSKRRHMVLTALVFMIINCITLQAELQKPVIFKSGRGRLVCAVKVFDRLLKREWFIGDDCDSADYYKSSLSTRLVLTSTMKGKKISCKVTRWKAGSKESSPCSEAFDTAGLSKIKRVNTRMLDKVRFIYRKLKIYIFLSTQKKPLHRTS